MFSRGVGTSRIYVCILVDDLLMVGEDGPLKTFTDKFARDFKLKLCNNDTLSYIGLDIAR